MNSILKGAAKRLTFSLILVSALGGCAVYGPPPGPYTYGTDANGQPVYTVPYYYPYSYPTYSPYYYDPFYIGPPAFFNFGFGGGHRDHDHDRGFRGGHGGGFRGDHGHGGRGGDPGRGGGTGGGPIVNIPGTHG
ncbi:hypothetical protein [Rhodoferax sediminis]|jgi:hypothetical protein|uniref:hypothetical protein n=1 Tax=Rhodoferax sediminis TaxID=2509614 RepID=UPI001FCE755D|nr:hypothetical protein [Rhodoferax sediminis]